MKILLCLALAAPAAAQEIKPCPDEFPVEAVKISSPPGWVGVAPPRLLLTSAAVVVGEATNGVLIGERRKTRNGFDMTYDEISTGLPPHTQIWLSCRYGDLALAQRLPANTDRCVVSYAKNRYAGYDIDVACRTKPLK